MQNTEGVRCNKFFKKKVVRLFEKPLFILSLRFF